MRNIILTIAIFLTVVCNAGTITLTYNDNSDNEDGFVIERKVDDGDFVEIDRVGPDVETYIDESPAVGSMNTYRVAAFNSFGLSGYTNEAGKGAFVPDAPDSLQSEITIDLTVRISAK